MNKALFSSSRDDWVTPPDFFAELDKKFRFTLDAYALPETAKCADYFTPEDDGLSRPWIAPRGARYFATHPIPEHGRNFQRAYGPRGGRRLKIKITVECIIA